MKMVLAFLLAVSGLASVADVRTPRERLLQRLSEIAESKSFYWAWTHPWLDVWNRNGDSSFAVKAADGRYKPQPTEEVRLASVYQKYSDGKRPLVAYTDMAAIVGTWHSPRYYDVNRASMTAVIRRYWQELGGITVFSWHMDHPYCTNGFRQASYRYKSTGENRNVIRQILDGTGSSCGTDTLERKNHRTPCANPREWYMCQLKDMAVFLKGLVDEKTGERIPVIIRYGHECDGDWFWWGRGWCTAEEFRRFSRMTADYLRQECGEGQILFAYTPDRTWRNFGNEGDFGNTFLAYYPGDRYVDVIGLDDYSIGQGSDEKVEKSFAETLRKLRLMTEFASRHSKITVVSEAGGQKKRDDFWQYVYRLMTADGVKLAFVNTWSGTYGMLPDTAESEKDELTFARRPETLMEDSAVKTTGLDRLRAFCFDGCEIKRAEVGSNGVTEVEYVLRPSTSSYIRCTLALPEPGKWNGRFWGFGNGGAAGRVKMMTREAMAGNAAAHTDMGTSRGAFTDDVILDFGHRATHLMTVTAKGMTETFFRRKIAYSYFYGQSSGGGQGFHEAIRYPDDYDGIVAGVPANTRLPLHIYFAYNNRIMRDVNGKDIFTSVEMDAVKQAAIDSLSGNGPEFARSRFLVDSRWTQEGENAIIARATELCPSLSSGDKLDRIRCLFRGPEIGGRRIHCGIPFGSNMRLAYGNQWLLDWWFQKRGVKKPLYRVTDDELLAWEKEWSANLNACSENLDRFFARGGKLIFFGGLEDSCVPYLPMIDWYERVETRYGSRISECCRFYLIPGRSHGWGEYVGGIHDDCGLLCNWVERGIIPDAVSVETRNGLKPFTIKPYSRMSGGAKVHNATRH